jgi:hypothetical protein
MPATCQGIEIQTQRKGHGGYIKFTHEENLAASMENQQNIVGLEYGSGYALVGMSDRYTIRLLGQEFCALIGDGWSLYPSVSYQRLMDGTVVRETVAD